MSAIAPADGARVETPTSRILFAQPILTEPGRQRLALTVDVDHLAELLRELDEEPYALEHVYDY